MYQKDVIQLYKELSKKYNCDYRLEFNNRKTVLGSCNYNKKVISLSKPYIESNKDEVIKNTILHEIAHALTKSGHDKKWKLKYIEIGGNGNRVNYEAVIKYKYIATCPECGYETEYNKRQSVACHKCCVKYNNGKFSNKYILIFTENKNIKL